MAYPHTSVLVQEFLHFFEERKIRSFIDGTLGAGGHAEALLKAHPEIEVFIGVDQDPSALEIAKARLLSWSQKTHFFRGNFSLIHSYLEKMKLERVDGILVDLGVSSMQLDNSEKGFSFMRDGPLDMRMDPDALLSAEEIVNDWPEQELGRIFRVYGEEKKWRKAAHIIAEERKRQRITSTLQLVEILEPVLRDPAWVRKSKIHPLTKTFQALRIAVNQELKRLEEFLAAALNSLNQKGLLAVITFHSLEDRIVKHFFQHAASDKVSTSGKGGIFLDKKREVQILTRKPIEAKEEENIRNPRSRSAKLRVVERL